MARWQHLDAREQDLVAGDLAEHQVLGEPRIIEARRHDSRFEQCLHFGTERHAARGGGEVERLDAGAIARQQQPFRLAIPQRVREDSVEARDTGVAFERVKVQHHLGVAVRAELHTLLFEVGAQFLVVVDLAVVDDDVAAVGREHRLMAAAEIDDAEAPVPEAHRAFDEVVTVVGAAVQKAVAHRRDTRRIGSAFAQENSDQSAHWSTTPGPLVKLPI